MSDPIPLPDSPLSYVPAWIGRLTPDVVLSATALKREVTGRDTLRALVGHARTLYEFQDFRYKGEYEDGFVEEYDSAIQGTPIKTIVHAHYNADGDVDNVVITHRPLNSVLKLSALLHTHFGDRFGDLFHRGEQA